MVFIMKKSLLLLIILFNLISCDRIKDKQNDDQNTVSSNEFETNITIQQQDYRIHKSQEHIRSAIKTLYTEELRTVQIT